MTTALITGASDGIGLEMAKIHASKGGDLILVARSADKLLHLKEELESAHKINVRVIGKDLSNENAALEVYNEVKAAGITVDYLINNAGFGDFGFFTEGNWEKQNRMIQLNITTLTQFTRLFLSDMIVRRSGKIVNVASTASFQPGPLMAVYYATKAYVLHFSEAVNNEIAGSGVTITALCPGATASGFQKAAGMEESKLVKGRKLPTSIEVAAFGYRAMLNGKTVAIPGLMNKLMVFGVRFLPRKWVVKVARSVQDKRR